jgi:hypothetical protein
MKKSVIVIIRSRTLRFFTFHRTYTHAPLLIHSSHPPLLRQTTTFLHRTLIILGMSCLRKNKRVVQSSRDDCLSVRERKRKATDWMPKTNRSDYTQCKERHSPTVKRTRDRKRKTQICRIELFGSFFESSVAADGCCG